MGDLQASIDLRALAEELADKTEGTNNVVIDGPDHTSNGVQRSHSSSATSTVVPRMSSRGVKRKAVGGLRPARTVVSDVDEAESECEIQDDERNDERQQSSSIRRLQCDVRNFPQRRKQPPKKPSLKPSTLDKLIQGVWEQIFGSIRFDPQTMVCNKCFNSLFKLLACLVSTNV